MSNQQSQQNQNNKIHRWEPGTLIRLCSFEPVEVSTSTNNQMPVPTPLFRGPRGRQKAFLEVPHGAEVMYVDSDGDEQFLMIQVIYQDVIGWTYWDCGRQI